MAKKTTTTTTTTVAKTNENTKYAKLLGTVDYDHEAVEQLADALNEVAQLEARAEQLKGIINENKELHQFVWRTADNESVAVHNIDDDHLSNIMMHLLRRGRSIPRAIRGEAMKRQLVIPAKVPITWKDPSDPLREARARLITGGVIEAEDWDA